MPGTRWFAIGVAVASASAGVAMAASRSAETTPVTADFRAALTSQQQRVCGESHTKFRLTFEGSQTSSDPRLVGALEAKVRSVVNNDNGYGSTEGFVLIRDPATGRLKFHGRVVGVLEPDGGAEGFIHGRTVGESSVRLMANFNLQQDQTTGAISGEFGKDTQSGPLQDPAILTNACGGHHHKHDGGHRHGHHHGRGR